MKNSEISTITIPRNKEIQANIHTAMIRLNEFNGWKVGLPLIVKYYNEDQKVDTIFAVGVKDSGASSTWNRLDDGDDPSAVVVPIIPEVGERKVVYREKKYYEFVSKWSEAEFPGYAYTWTKLAEAPQEYDRELDHVPVSTANATLEQPEDPGFPGEIVKVDEDYYSCERTVLGGAIIPENNTLPDNPTPNVLYQISEYFQYSTNTWIRVDETPTEYVEVLDLPETGESGVYYKKNKYFVFSGSWDRLTYLPDAPDFVVDTLPSSGVSGKIYYLTPDYFYEYVTQGSSGREFYNIISTREEFVVDDVLEIKPYISYALNGERYLYYYENETDKIRGIGQWRIARRVGNRLGPGIPITPVICVIKNLSNNLRYFYQRTSEGDKTVELLRREDDFITSNELITGIDEITNNLKKEITEFSIIGGDTYSSDNPKSNIQVHVKIEDFGGVDVTEKFTLEILETENVRRLDNNTIQINDEITTTTTYTLRAIQEETNKVIEKSITVYMVKDTYYGKMNSFEINNLASMSKTLWNGQGEFEFTVNLERIIQNNIPGGQITVLAYPKDILSGDITSIKDGNGLDYINDYETIEVSWSGSTYKIYYKKDPVVISNFKQIFSYERN